MPSDTGPAFESREMKRKYPVLRLGVVVGDQPGWPHHDGVPALDLIGPPGLGPYIPRRWPNQSSGSLLLENVGAPAGDPGAGEHRGEHLRRNFGEIQNHGGPELDVRRECSVGSSLPVLIVRLSFWESLF